MNYTVRAYCEKYVEYLLKKYPTLDVEECQELVTDKLISRKIPVRFDLVQEIVQVLYDEIFDKTYNVEPEY